MSLAPQTRLGPYEILELLGAGGMGEVYKATDARLGRIVAIKVLHRAHMERFEREARAIAALNHPHICALYDVGPDYLVMEYVEGVPIKGPMQAGEVTRLALQIAGALEEAHGKGIIHRDLKPGNILLTSSGVKLLDFGLAKVAHLSDVSDNTVTRTKDGTILGTAAYMSPEQAEGRNVDARSDVFSFGLVVYEMLSGRRAFIGETAISTMAAILHKQAEPLLAPPELQRVINRCLEKQPAQRFQTMTEVREALERAGTAPLHRQPSIAVLPFANMSGDKENEYFSDGLSEEIINALTQIPGVKVTARTSAFSFRGKEIEIPEIGRRLNVEHVLEGSVRRAGNRIRVTAQLVKVADGFHLWSERYDREMTDVFAVQDEITGVIVEKLKVNLSREEGAGRRHSRDLEAYNAYLKGRYYMHRPGTENMAKAKDCFETAIAADSNYALAHSSLAWHYFTYPATGAGSALEYFPKAKALLLRALELDSTLAEARVLLGVIRGCFEFDWEGGERDVRQALESEAVSADAYGVYGRYFLWPNRRIADALAAVETAQQLDPLDPVFVYFVGEVHFIRGRFELALEQFRKTLDLAPGYWVAHLLSGWSYLGLRQFEDAGHAFDAAMQLEPDHPFVWAAIGSRLALMGRLEEAREVLDRLAEAGPGRFVAPMTKATICYHLGDLDRTLALIEEAIETRDSSIFWMTSGIYYEPLWSHPRFPALLERMNLK